MKPTTPMLFALQPHKLADSLSEYLPCSRGKLEIRLFPDGESYLRVDTSVVEKHCIVVADLSKPNEKYLPLVFLLETLRELGASSIGLIAPYLCYMRQDKRFVEGEAITSRIFAKQLSQHANWLVTVDPHLHRYHCLGEIYGIPSYAVPAAPELATWLQQQKDILLVGPDAESEQWVSQIAAICGHAYVIGEKERRGDRDVEVSLPDLTKFHHYTAVIIDDVIASGHTILNCIEALKKQDIQQIKCATVHGIFSDRCDDMLMNAGLTELITTNTIPHPSNKVDVTEILIQPIKSFLAQQGQR